MWAMMQKFRIFAVGVGMSSRLSFPSEPGDVSPRSLPTILAVTPETE
jgi:hypothetical protein